MFLSSPSGKCHTQLNMAAMESIKGMVHRRAKGMTENEFNGVWKECVVSISKACQNLRNGHQTMYAYRLQLCG